jgi:DNA polymerase-3 subunit delta
LYKAVAALGKDAIRDCVLPKPWDMPKRVREMAPRHKITLTADAAQALYELIGDDTIHLDAALEKIALGRSSTTPVSAAEIRGEVARTAEIKPWDFTDAFIERDLAKCLEVLSCIRDSSPHALMTMTLKNIRYLMHMKSIVKEFGSPNDAVLKRFINEEYDQAAKLLELTSPQDKSAKPKRMADFTAKKIMKNQGRFSEAELRRALYAARETEKAMKSGADPDKAFERWVIDALGRRP